MAVVQIRGKGNITLPIELRRAYQVDEGDVFTITALGDGAFLLTPQASKVQQLGQRIVDEMVAAGVQLDDLLAALDEEREAYYREHYAGR
jgi:bifunctional DNA-binding transcriptional regulator/antitoxin component of YhaV-PrlF toxin-antitoxin module